MKTFSPVDAAFEGFRLTRENPRAVVVWSLLYFAVNLALVGVLFALGLNDELMRFETLRAAGDPTNPELVALTQQLQPFLMLMIAAGMVLSAVNAGAVFRMVLRRQDRGFGYLRFGPDELRLLVLTLTYIGLVALLIFVVILIAQLSFGLLAALPLGPIVLLGIMALGVRLSLAGPMTFDEGRLRVFRSWKLTRGVFWRLLGAYVLAMILALIVTLLALIPFFLIAFIITGDIGAGWAVFNPDLSSAKAFLTPVNLLASLFTGALNAAGWVLVGSPAAVAYRELRTPKEERDAA